MKDLEDLTCKGIMADRGYGPKYLNSSIRMPRMKLGTISYGTIVWMSSGSDPTYFSTVEPNSHC